MIDLLITGLETLRAGLLRLPQVIRREVAPAVNNTSAQMANAARARVAVRTGRLKGAIAATPATENGNRVSGGLVLTDPQAAEYAFYVEFGTVYMAAQPFILPALDEVRATFEQELQAAGARTEAEMNR
jgi:HK97 gp10 family phage protein